MVPSFKAVVYWNSFLTFHQGQWLAYSEVYVAAEVAGTVIQLQQQHRPLKMLTTRVGKIS